jgi:hypothetical protein
MKIEQMVWKSDTGWKYPGSPDPVDDAQLVLLFGDGSALSRNEIVADIKQKYPVASILGCTTAGEISGTNVLEGSLVAAAIHFNHSRISGTCIKAEKGITSYDAGRQLAQQIDKDGLRHVFVLSEGLSVNGSELVKGLTGHLPGDVTVTGGLSGDGGRFERTLVLWDDELSPNTVAAIGLCGDRLRVGFGSQGGWDPFGPERLITKSDSNVLRELDGQSALELYRRYLGEHAHGLPATGLLFPLSLRTGFYSYGEISPFAPGAKCELHNQTMTVTTLSEV